MSLVSIDMPDKTRLQYEVENFEIIEKIVQIIKKSGVKKKSDEIVGIWNDRFTEDVSSEKIQKEYREKTWVRF